MANIELTWVPVIDAAAQDDILKHCSELESKGRLLFRVPLPDSCPLGTFVAPVAFRLNDFSEMTREIFGPVLHVLTYEAQELDDVVERINTAGYGLTLGIHSRIDARVDKVCEQARVGNIYVNRNQIGAIVGVQPFGGEGLSGTGPKAGGPHYLTRFTKPVGDASTAKSSISHQAIIDSLPKPLAKVAETALGRAAGISPEPLTLPGPTGELNTYVLHPRGVVLCLGPDDEALTAQAMLAFATGNKVMLAEASNAAKPIATALAGSRKDAVIMVSGDIEQVVRETDFDAVLFDGDDDMTRKMRVLLAERKGPRIPILDSADGPVRLCGERVVSEDTTASGGNATLLAATA